MQTRQALRKLMHISNRIVKSQFQGKLAHKIIARDDTRICACVCVCLCVSNARWVYPVWLFINKHRGSLSFRHSFRLFRLHSFSSEFCIFIAVVYRRSINESATFVWRCFLFFSFFFLSLAEKLERRIWFWKRWKDLQDSIIYWVNESLGRSKQQWIYFHILEIDR